MKKINVIKDRSRLFLLSFLLPSPSICLHSAVHSELPSAIGTRVACILHSIHTEGNQTTPSPTADQNQTSTSQPSQRTWVVSYARDYSCTAIRADHGHGRFAIHCVPHNNSSWLLDDRCRVCSLAGRWRRPIALRRRVALLRWWVALLWWVAWLLRISGLGWGWVASLIRWRLVRHLGFCDPITAVASLLLKVFDSFLQLPVAKIRADDVLLPSIYGLKGVKTHK